MLVVYYCLIKESPTTKDYLQLSDCAECNLRLSGRMSLLCSNNRLILILCPIPVSVAEESISFRLIIREDGSLSAGHRMNNLPKGRVSRGQVERLVLRCLTFSSYCTKWWVCGALIGLRRFLL